MRAAPARSRWGPPPTRRPPPRYGGARGRAQSMGPSADTPPATAIRRALARARDGKTLDQGEAATLLHARGADLDRLLSYASRARDAGIAAAGRPGVITYSRKVFIPLTRL